MEGVDSHYVRKIIKLAYLSPDVTVALLKGEYHKASIQQLSEMRSLFWFIQVNIIELD